MAGSVVYSGSCSTVTTEKSTFLWVLKKLSTIPDKSLVSKAFSAVDGDCAWCLDLRPNELKDNQKWVGLYLSPAKRVPLQQLSCKFVMMNSKGSEIKSQDFVREDYNGESRGYINFMKRSDLLEKLDDDVLKICVDVTAVFSEKRTDIHKARDISSMASVLLTSKKFSDFVIRAQDTDIPVHKSILAARSPVFEAMFNSETKETELGRVDLQDMELTTVRAMIEFFYVCEVSGLNLTLALELLSVGDKYNVVNMVKYCSQYLRVQLCCSNAIDIVVAAADANAFDLKKHCIKFIVANSGGIQMEGKQRDDLEQRQELKDEIFCKFFKQAEAP